jgi:basic membrane protein A
MRRSLILAAGALAFAAAPLAPAGAADPLKIGFVYVSPVGSAGWTFSHDQARKYLEKTLAGKVTTSFVEKVPEGADAVRVIRQLAASGHKLIFTTSFGYMDPTIAVARRFPKITFMHATGYKRAKNVGTYIARFYEGRYLAGVVAGKMTKSNTAGYVAAFPIPEVVRGINAFTRGMRSVNPKAQVRVVWVNSWYDPGKEREAAEALIRQGADVIMQHTDSTAPVQAAEAKGVYAIGYHSDMSAAGPKAHLTASIHDWREYYVRVAKQVLVGTWKSDAVWWGIKEGMVKLAPFNKAVPQDVRDLVAAREAAIKAGTLHPFAGPVKDQGGKVRVAAGKNMSDKALLGMNYYVEGVIGSLPKK